MTGALLVGVVRLVLCANDAGESASKKISDSTCGVRGNMNEVRGTGLTECFIRELMVLDIPKIVLGEDTAE